jgi:predicted acylesterase/phospholipase RssA
MEPEKSDVRKGIGLALSGGGFRATLFHLGVVRFLYEAGSLTSVKRISAVSGGSILAAHLALNWELYTGPHEAFDTAARGLLQFVRDDVRGRVVRRWILGWLTGPRLLLPRPRRWTGLNLLVGQYARLFGDATLKDLRGPGRPDVALNCTSLSTGDACYFNASGFTWNVREEHVAAPDTPLALAVAASSAFPPLFPPITISHETLYCDKRKFPHAHHLTDGGVYDNLGIDRLVGQKSSELPKDLSSIIVSDAEGNFDWELDSDYIFPVARNVRASNILMTRVSSLQFSNLFSGQPSFVHVRIKEELVDPDDPSLLSPSNQRSLANLRTDLDEFSPIEITSLIAHGYSTARRAFARAEASLKPELLPRAHAPKFSWDPLGNWVQLQSQKSTTEKLRKSSRRKCRIWSFRDWAGWVTAVAIVIYATVMLTVMLLGAAAVWHTLVTSF